MSRSLLRKNQSRFFHFFVTRKLNYFCKGGGKLFLHAWSLVFLSCSNWNGKKLSIRSVCLIVNSFVYKKFSNKSLYILKRNDGALGFLEIQEREYCLYLFKIWMQGVTIGCFVAWIANELAFVAFSLRRGCIQFARISLYGMLWFFPREYQCILREQKWKISLYKY